MATSFFAYLMTKEEMFGRKIIYRFVIITMYLNAGLIPWYMTMKTYGLKDNFLLYVIPGAVSAYYMILIKTYIESLPAALEESARIDGAGYIRVFRSIIFPLSKPIVATVAIYAAVGQWNTWTDNYFLVNKANLQTLQMILYNYLNQSQNIANISAQALTAGTAVVKITSMSIKMCITVIVTVPIICVYPFMQRYFVKGIMMGAVKG
jgi:ABC-type glycerol-3-phosphate transport system permease component